MNKRWGVREAAGVPDNTTVSWRPVHPRTGAIETARRPALERLALNGDAEDLFERLEASGFRVRIASRESERPSWPRMRRSNRAERRHWFARLFAKWGYRRAEKTFHMESPR